MCHDADSARPPTPVSKQTHWSSTNIEEECGPVMNGIVEHLLQHGYAAIFLYVLASQLGVPVPAAPMMLAAGALAATGRIALAPAALAVVIACLCADALWYVLGRTRGRQVVRFLCRLSLEPESCVQSTENAIHRYGTRFLLVAKFLPGLGLMAAPVAGESRAPYARFLAFDALGATLWASTYLLIGRLFGGLLERNTRLLQLAAEFGIGALLTVVVGFVLIRLVRRRRFRRSLTSVGITPAELKARLDGGEPLVIVDVRSLAPTGEALSTLPGAVSLTRAQLLADGAIPKDRDVVVFCDCPGDAGSAEVATSLQRRGFVRVHHLRGGYAGWSRAGYPLG